MDLEHHKQIKSQNELENKETKIKRQRSENWCEEDKELLKELIKKRVQQIENKNTDTNTNQLKKKAWMDLEKDFNSLCSGKKRLIGQLKSQWTTIKMNAKKEISEFRTKSKQTGGGLPPPEVQLSANDISIWLPNEFVVDTNEYDCDFAKDCAYEEENVSDISVAIQEPPLEKEQIKVKEVEVNAKCNERVTHCKKKTDFQKNRVPEESIHKITQNELECRQELHLLQIEVEKMRITNLKLKFEILQTKLLFHKKKLTTFVTTDI